MPGSLLLPCDVTNDAEIAAVFQRVDEEFGRLDAMLHSVAYAPKEDLENGKIVVEYYWRARRYSYTIPEIKMLPAVRLQ